MGATVVVLGSVNVDLTAYASPLPRPGETRTGQSFTEALGGKGANQAVAVARSGVDAILVGCVGSDGYGDLARHALAEAGVRLDQLATVGPRTGIAHIRVDAGSGQNDIVVVPLANAALDEDRASAALTALAASLDPAETVLLLQLEVPVATVVAAAAFGRAAGWTVVLDPAPATELPSSLWAEVDVVTPNESEAEAYAGGSVSDEAGAVVAGRWFVDRGVGRAVVTRGAADAVVVSTTGTRTVAGPPTEVVDTTAAGDAFTGNLAAALAAGRPFDEAVQIGARAGAYAVAHRGASPSMPSGLVVPSP